MVNLSVDFRIFKPDDVRKRELLVKKGRKCEFTENTALWSVTNDYDMHDFERFPKGFDWKYDCYVPPNKLSNK